MDLFKIGFIDVTLVDLIDVALVSFIFYKLYMVMRGTVAAQIFVGLVLILAFSFLSQAINFKAMNWILRTLTDIWVIAFIVLFQPELRRLLVLVGRNRVVRMFLKLNVEESIEEVAGAAAELARKHHGMLVVLIRTTALRTMVETGVPLQARVSKPLLVSIFNPRSPLHDGAVVVHERTIEAARVTLPLSQTDRVGDSILGMRHRAALGISEQADVISVVVSEENGSISIADNGVLTRGLSAQELRHELHARLSSPTDKSAKSIWKILRS
ncbi:MAG TPA: diadenylate cyclase CdaA [Bacteroidota bacterium]|jgi:diadenylate cyclase|nr:diadenylate cyclase CdaA [Bacteroidota bacterium]